MSDRLTEIRERLTANLSAATSTVGSQDGEHIVRYYGDDDCDPVDDLRYLLAEVEWQKQAREREAEPMRLMRQTLETIGNMPEEIKKLRDDNERLRSIMRAGAQEIEEHWDAHCNAHCFGPVNLVRRLYDGTGDYRVKS